MRLLWFQVFREAVRCGSLGEASRTLGYTQSAVSRHIAALEAEYGAPLLERGPTGVRLSPPGGQNRQLRVRIVMHIGNVHEDDNGYFGDALDIAFRLLDAPHVKAALTKAPSPLVLVVSGDAGSVAPHGPEGSGHPASRRLVTAEVAGHEYQGWIHAPTEPA